MKQRPISIGLGRIAAIVCALSMACDRSPPPDSVSAGRAFIIIDIDTLRADRLGCYGYQRDTSPAFDAFAASGVRFDWAFSQAPYTAASQTSILTSLYPSTHGVIRGDRSLDDDVTTLAEAFAAAGYRTAAFVDGGFMSPDSGLAQGFETYDNNGRKLGLAAIGPRVDRWLEAHAGEDFLLLIHTYDVHAPYIPPEPFASRFTAEVAAPSPGFVPDAATFRKVRFSIYEGELEPLAANDLAFASARYDGGIAYVDAWFERFLAKLRELGLDQRATIVVTSDHGEEFQEHGSVLHEKLYATVTRVPFLLRYPGGPAGRVIDTAVETLDLMPTLLSLAQIPPVPGMQGTDLVPLIESRASGPRVTVGETPDFGRWRAISHGRFRLQLSNHGRRAELFDYRADPHELDDIAADHPAVVERLRRGLDGWQREVEAAAHAARERTIDEETLEQLRALGYVD